MYTKQLDCAKKWTATEPNNVAAQRVLSTAFLKVGDMNVRRGQFNLAHEFHAQGLEIVQKLASAKYSTLTRHDLAKAYISVGEMWRKSGS